MNKREFIAGLAAVSSVAVLGPLAIEPDVAAIMSWPNPWEEGFPAHYIREATYNLLGGGRDRGILTLTLTSNHKVSYLSRHKEAVTTFRKVLPKGVSKCIRAT